MDNSFRIVILFIFSVNILIGQEVETTSSYDVNLKAAIDTRFVIKELNDTLSIDYPYDGLITYIKSTDKYYYYYNSWKELTLGTSSEASVGPVDYIDFTNNAGTQSYLEGRIFYDTVDHTLTLYDDESESSLQIGQEQRVRVYNANGVTIINGYAVSVTGVTAEGILQVGLANAADKESAINTIGIATHDIEAGTYGWATTSGIVRDVNTSSLTEGAAIYLSDSIDGWYTTVRPSSPSYEVRMGGVVKQDAVNGELYAELRIITNTHDNFNFFTGASLESSSATITTDGSVVTAVLSNNEGGDSINLIFDYGYLTVPSGISTNLTLGTDAAPVENFVYITDQGVMTTSTSSFPLSGDFVPIGRYVVPSAARSNTYGIYKSHAYTDHLRGGVNGHLLHINQWIRKRPAAWQSGVVMTTSVAEDVAIDTIDLSFTSGVVAQLHDQTFPAFDTETDASFVANDFATNYELVEGITPSIDTDSEGDAIGNNKYYNLVVWGVVSEEAKDCKIFYNLPSGSYTSEADALNDLDDYTNFSIPSEYTGTGFLISKLTLQRTNTTVKIVGITDLRGLIPIAGGGATSGGAGITSFDELTDSPVSKTGSALYNLRVNATENAIEYVEREPNFYLDNDTLSSNRIVEMNSNDLGFVGGNVGIGTQGPLSLLDLSGTTPQIAFIDTSESDLNKQVWTIQAVGENLYFRPKTEFSYFGTGTPSIYPVAFSINSTNNSVFAQNLGVGVNTPLYNFHLEGSDPTLMMTNNTQSADDQDWALHLNGGDFGIYNYNDINGETVLGMAYLNIDQSGNIGAIGNFTTLGNVGIGTTSPSAKLDIDENNINNSVLKVGGFSLQPYSNDNIILANNDTYYSTDSIGFVRSGANGSSWIHLVNQYIHFRSTPSGNPDSTYVHADMMSVQPEGVGIGTTSPSAKLHIDDYYQSGSDRQFQIKHFNIQDLNTRNTLINTNAYYEGIAGEMTPIDTGGFVSMQMYHSGIRFRGGTGNAGVSAPRTTFMHIDNSDANRGNIGIGTTAPSSLIHLKEVNNSTTASQLLLQNEGGGFHTSAIAFQVSSTGETTGFAPKAAIAYERGLANGRGKMHFYNDSANDANAYADGDEKMTLDNDGNLGIGTTSPIDKLEINGPSGYFHVSEAAHLLTRNLNNSGSKYWGWNPRGSGRLDISYGELNVSNTINSTDAVISLDTTGNLGIGTTSPSANLHIDDPDGGDNDLLFLKSDLSETVFNSYGGIYTKHSGDKYWGIESRGASAGYTLEIGYDTLDVSYHTQISDPFMAIDTSGNIGIGTTSPSEKLHVVGNALFSSIGSGTSAGALHYEADGTLTTNTSDRRLKKNIVEVNDSIALTKLLELQPKEFEWKQSSKVMRDSAFITETKENIIALTMGIDSLQDAETGSGTFIADRVKELKAERKTARNSLESYRETNKKRVANAKRKNIGFIAQDVKKVLPEAVGENADGYMFIRDQQISAVAVSAIKAQQKQIDEQKLLIQQLLERIEKLENE